jgi:hypothetical protein
MITTSIINKQGDKLHIKVGDEVTVKNTGGNYSTYGTFFDEREEELIKQMGEQAFIMAKNIYKREEYVDIKKRKYRVIGMAKHIDRREQEVLVLLDEFDGQVYLFCNRAMYLDIDKSSNDYNEINLRDIVANYGNHIMLHLDDDTVLYIDNE